MKQKLLFCLTFLVLTLSGCKKEVVVDTSPPPDYNHITWQTDNVSTITSNFMEDGAFYVEHTNENGTKIYYSLGTPTGSDNHYYYSADSEDIPTLFLGQGDKLIYHSFTKVLNNIYLSRLEDLGYSIGISGFSSLENGRCVLNTDSAYILPTCTDAAFLQDQEANYLLVDEMGITLPSGYTFDDPQEGMNTVNLKGDILSFYKGLEVVTTRKLSDYNTESFDPKNPNIEDIKYPKLTKENVRKGILYGLEKNQSYHLEFYSGTYHASGDLKSNIHILSPREYFYTYNYNLRQDMMFDIILPELPNGIYMVGENGVGSGKAFRLINEKDYSIENKFEEYLFPVGIYGVASDVPGHNQLSPVSSLNDYSSVYVVYDEFSKPFEETYKDGLFLFDTEPETQKNDNRISWYYQKDGVELGRILDRHEEFFTKKDKATLTTVIEIAEDKYLVRIFDCDFKASSLYDDSKSMIVETFKDADYMFKTTEGLSLKAREATSGILVLNASLVSVEGEVSGATEEEQELEDLKELDKYFGNLWRE